MSIKSGKKAVFSDINITPLTDIFLVLLIIMMVVAPTFQSMDNAITIPEINSGTSIEQGKTVVSVTKDGSIYVDTKKTTMDMLRKDLEAVKSEENSELIVKADEKVKSSVIMEIMDAAQDTHYKKLIVAGEPLNKKDQKKLEGVNSGVGGNQSGINDMVNNTNSAVNKSALDGANTSLPQDEW